MVVNLSLQLTPTQWYVIISTIWCIILTVNGVFLLFIELLKANAFINIAIPYCSIVHASLVTSSF